MTATIYLSLRLPHVATASCLSTASPSTHTPSGTRTPSGTCTSFSTCILMSISPIPTQTDSSQAIFLQSPTYFSEPEPSVMIEESDYEKEPGNVYISITFFSII